PSGLLRKREVADQSGNVDPDLQNEPTPGGDELQPDVPPTEAVLRSSMGSEQGTLRQPCALSSDAAAGLRPEIRIQVRLQHRGKTSSRGRRRRPLHAERLPKGEGPIDSQEPELHQRPQWSSPPLRERHSLSIARGRVLQRLE